MLRQEEIEQVDELLIRIAEEHGEENASWGGYATSASALRQFIADHGVSGCTNADVIHSLKTLHDLGSICIQRWAGAELHQGFRPWEGSWPDFYFNDFRLLARMLDAGA